MVEPRLTVVVMSLWLLWRSIPHAGNSTLWAHVIFGRSHRDPEAPSGERTSI
jgi:hypothetical protein